MKNDEVFLNKLLSKPQDILTLLCDGFSVEDSKYVDLKCNVRCNIPVEFRAEFGNGAGCWIIGEKPNGESLYDTSDKSGLIEILENLELPDTIIFTEVKLEQKVQKSKSEFKYSLINE